MDVHYLAEKNYFDIGHDRREESIFLNLKDLLKLAVIRDEEIRPLQTKLWIDFKNLNEYNMQKSLQTLLGICKETGFNIKNLIVES
ncbi:hypothetical protein V5I60_001823, partial [Campylobacter coli]|nr:peptidase S14 [Campylobacter coli]EAL7162637.1 peptidase S14 [Campylobacter coli]